MTSLFTLLLGLVIAACGAAQQAAQPEPPPQVEPAETADSAEQSEPADSAQQAEQSEPDEPAAERPLAEWLELPDDVEPIEFATTPMTFEYAGQTSEWTILLADEPRKTSRGLMYWTGLPNRHAMLFIFQNAPVHSGFWNRNVPIDLSVAFLDQTGRILEFVHLDAQDPTGKRPADPYWFALEVPRGRFLQHGIQLGDRLAVEQLPDSPTQ